MSEKDHPQKSRSTRSQRKTDAGIETLIQKLESGVAPETQEQKEPNLFDQPAGVVADMIKGATVVIADKRVVIANVQAFPTVKQPHFFKSALEANPGTITGVLYRGRAIMPNITASERGLVMPTAVSTRDENGNETLFTRPTDIAKTLGLGPNESGVLNIVDPEAREFSLVKATPIEQSS